MKSTVRGLLVALLLPVLGVAQTFKAPDLSQSDMAFFAKELEKHSPLVQQLYATAAVRTDMKPEEARALINQKLDELGNESLKRIYAKMDAEQALRIGIVLHLLLNGYNNLPNGYDGKMQFGGGVGVFLMYTLAQFVLMPELSVLFRPAAVEYSEIEQKQRYTYLNLAFTAMYVIQAARLRILLGLSPNIGYALGGSYRYDDEDWEDIDFDGNANRVNVGLGIVAGIMLQNAMTLRLMYNMGLSKMYDVKDSEKMYALALMLTIPLWSLNK